MIIKNFSASYQDGLTIQPLQFESNMTLLVGPSGVGKTSILNALHDIRKIINGFSINGFEWDIIINYSNNDYRWKGKFSFKEKNFLDELSVDPKEDFIRSMLNALGEKKTNSDSVNYIISESLYINDVEIINRELQKLKFKNKLINLELPKRESTLISLRDEADVQKFVSAIEKITSLNDDFLSVKGLNFHNIAPKSIDKDEEEDQNITLKKLKDLSWSIEKKLYFCKEKISNVFSEISERYKDIFPFIDEIIVKRFVYENNATRYVIAVREKESKNLIFGDSLSSGMSKTLMLLCYFYLSNENIVFLIDEFENGLGVNCLDEVVSLLSSDQYNNNIQFILTSHHPYIINNVDMNSWLVITRKKNIIHNSDPIKDLGLNISKHEAFLSLMNSSVYEESMFF